jgi:phytoene dehydrogenase-like protein
MANLASYDAIVVGSGPNGLAAAIVFAQAGVSTLLIEARDQIGGGTRTAELTLPGYRHDVCSAIHPMAAVSPFFRSLPLTELGIDWIDPPLALAHPFEDGTVATLERSLDGTAASLGADVEEYRAIFAPFARSPDRLFAALLGPLRWPREPLGMARFGLMALRSANAFAGAHFRGALARGLFAGCAAHSFLDFDRASSAAIGLALLLAAHTAGWPFPRGGSAAIAKALATHFQNLGGEIETGRPVRSLDDLPKAKAILFDLTPRQLLAICGARLSPGYRESLGQYRYGPGVFKLDWALDGPIPWKAPSCARAATVHVGGTLEAIAEGEAAVWRGIHPEKPFVLVAQQSLFDASRAPQGKHTGWAYCHVPHGSTLDMTAAIENQIERFAPGFRDRILARSRMGPAAFEQYNENYVGGDITGGVTDLGQLFSRPVARLVPYATSAKDLYIGSSSTPPGAGVHGMCGYFAARAALRRVFHHRIAELPS